MTKPLSFANATEECAYYGVKVSALRSWKAKGREAGDPFPSADPVAAVEWYRRHYRKGAPQTLLEAAARFSASPKKKKSKALEDDLEDLDQGGLVLALDRARRIEALYGSRLELALKEDNKADESIYRQPHLKAQNGLRDMERAVVDVAKKRRELIARNEVVTAWQSMHNHLPRALSKALTDAKPADLSDEVWSAAVRSATDKAMDLLQVQLPEILAGPPADEMRPEPDTQP